MVTSDVHDHCFVSWLGDWVWVLFWASHQVSLLVQTRGLLQDTVGRWLPWASMSRTSFTSLLTGKTLGTQGALCDSCQGVVESVLCFRSSSCLESTNGSL